MVSRKLFLALAQFFLLSSLPASVTSTWEDGILTRLNKLEETRESLTRQVMLQQFSVEESRRSDGDSGVKQVRMSGIGTKSFHTATHSTHSVASIHNHSDLKNTCGMGEIEAVLNGYHFRTRHNDYKLVKPSTTSSDYHAIEEIEFPPVPPEVTNKATVADEIREMRAWFRAWLDGNHTERDYRPYFRPLLCYLEGAWTNDVNIDEPFDSDRHHLDASSWYDLQEKARFTALSGDKDQAENFAHLPVSIVNVTDGQPVLAQWNYRILCHPVEGNLLELSDLKPVDDLSRRMSMRYPTLSRYAQSRAQRYVVNEFDRDRAWSGGSLPLLDKLMNQVPGKDNYMGDIEDTALGRTKYVPGDPMTKLNTAFYHRWYSIGEKDAMGVSMNHRGFADRNLFVAQTTQDRVVPVAVEVCEGSPRVCQTYVKRMTYAIPLEIVWLTPLNRWNPYDIEYKGLSGSDAGKTVTADGRNGGFTVSTAFNGTNHRTYMLTPVEFFAGGEHNPDPADTVRGAVGVLDRDGNVRRVSESGIRIHLPEIVDVGDHVRTRYPVMPIFAEGSTAFKELEAIKKILLDLEANLHMLHVKPNLAGSSQPSEGADTIYSLVTEASTNVEVGIHTHELELDVEDALDLMSEGGTYVIRTTLNNAHSHLLNITFDSTNQQFYYLTCDGDAECWDGHGTNLFRED